MVLGNLPDNLFIYACLCLTGFLLLGGICVYVFIVTRRTKDAADVFVLFGLRGLTIFLIFMALVNYVELSYLRKYGMFPFAPGDPLSWLELASPPYKCADIGGPQLREQRFWPGTIDDATNTRVVGVLRFLPQHWSTCEYHGICESGARARELRAQPGARAQELDLSVWDDHDRVVCDADGKDVF